MLSINRNTIESDIKKSEHTEPTNPDINPGKEIRKISRDGDTLEISSNGEEQSQNIRREAIKDKLVISETTKK